MMTAREIVYANLEHRSPERPAFHFDNGRLTDFRWAGVGGSETWKPVRYEKDGFEYYDDEWGNMWYRVVGRSQGGEIYQPAIRDWSDLAALRIPDFDAPGRFAGTAESFRAAGDRFKMAFMPVWVFATSRYLRRMEVYFTDLIEYRDEIDRLHEIVTSLAERMIRRFAEAGAEGIFFCEDLGVQDRTLIGPAMWRDIFGPHYRRLTGAAHELGMRVFMHSCGYNWALIDDLVDAGIDCFQFDQPAAYDMPALAAKLRERRVALYAPVDIQKVMPTGDRALIESEAERLVRTFKGCLIVKNYGDLKGIGVEPEWDEWAYQALLRASGIGADGRALARGG